MNSKNALIATVAAATLTAFGCASQAESTEGDGSEQSAKQQAAAELRGHLNANTGDAKLQPQGRGGTYELSDGDFPLVGGEPETSAKGQAAADLRNRLNANTSDSKWQPQGRGG